MRWFSIFCLIWATATWGQTTQPTSSDITPEAATSRSVPATSQPASQPSEKSKETTQATLEKSSTTQASVTIAGQTIRYQATAANMLMKDESGKQKASIFFVAYDKLPTSDRTAERPLTFVFNGGPGAAAVWLHLGTAGPRRIDLKPDGEAPAPPFRLVENAYSWLDATDLVFIDPVGTGFSRAAEGEKGEQFYGVKPDIESVADFIRLYISLYGRWVSPLFLAGESYGTTRAAGLSEHLLDQYGVALNGIILISSVLDFQTIDPGDSNDLPFALYLPSYTAIAWYHKRLEPTLQQNLQTTLQQVQQWAMETYLVALHRGSVLNADEKRDIASQLSQYTGLPTSLIEKANLRIEPYVFQKSLFGDQSVIIGRFDGRITGADPKPMIHWPSYDPSLARYLPIYSATFNDYVRRTLKYESFLPYEVLSEKVHPWKFGESSGYLSVEDNLRSAMVKNPHMRVLFASGYYDLATPFFAADYTIDRLNVSPELRGNIMHTYYEGGHMMYHSARAAEKLHTDIAAFVESSVPLHEEFPPK